MTRPAAVLPPVAADVAAAALDLLPVRLRKRVDGAVAKAAGWPVEATDDGVLVRVAEDTVVTLRVTAGIVADAADAVCGCLLAPACLHRAAVLSRAPLAAGAEAEAETADDKATGPVTVTGQGDAARPDGGGERGAVPAPTGDTPTAGAPAQVTPAALTPVQSAALGSLGEAATAVLVAGVTGSGAVHRAELLHAAHSARLAGLHRPAATAVRIARRLGEARSDDPAFRLSDLSADLVELLDLVRGSAAALAPARRGYRPEGPLRLHGLFTEAIVTASGYAGATVFALAPDGTLRTLSDVAPGGPERALQASGSPVPGGCALGLRDLGDGGGVILTSPTVSPDGRIGGGGQVRSVRATGAGWHEAPLAGLWERPPAAQLAAALRWSAEPADARAAGGDLLFLDGTVTGAGFAVTGGPTLRLAAPDERPELPYADNVRLLASRPGSALRLIARAVPDRPDRIHVLAASWAGHDHRTVRADLGLRLLHRSDVAPVRDTPAASVADAPPPALPVELDLLRRAVERGVAGGRAVAAAAGDGELPRRLRAVGLTTGAQRVQALAEAAADRRHDVLGRLLPADPTGFARAWLAAAVYASAAAESLLLAAWTPAEPAAN
ncbi:hypothetical protein [Streptomyces liangshanensis]|uniref:SWIM-type domain-containing protein n=1 Tax=Streptomyces liangshanensis TaxID=2717324 RepID=A0A6G9H3Y4_9ACTN|nr:hypothetical protein [Streptomyces liangshanensis]QIQ04941.1 hypothetical protein HA039_24055 [Streptomyces liangshanensis]